MQKQHHFTYRVHMFFLLVYFLCSVTLFWNSAKNVGFNFGLAIMLVWNCFLSFLPVLFARHSIACREKQNHLWLLWMVLWIVFWPNTFYMITDVSHFTGNSFYQEIPYQSPVYSTQIQLWIKAIIIVVGILYGVLNGITSEMILEHHIIIWYGKKKQIIFRAVCSILGGIAIYIGRFLRLNSWDIFRPIKILATIRLPQYSWLFSLSFSGVFAILIFIILSVTKPLIQENTD